MHNLIIFSEFTNFRSTAKFSINFKFKGKIKKASVIAKVKLLIYQLVKIIVSFFILLFSIIYLLVFGISLRIYFNFFVDFRCLVTKSV